MVGDEGDEVEERVPLLEDEEDEEDDVELEESEFVDEGPEDGEGVEVGRPWVEEDKDEDGLGVSCERVGDAGEEDDPAPPDELECATSDTGLELGLREEAWRLSNHCRFSSAS
jgi:hypothetical protein